MRSPWQANKNHNKGNFANLWAKLILRPAGNVVAYPFIFFGIGPNVVTWLSLFSGLLGALLLATSNIFSGILFVLFAQFLDYSDGTVARATNKCSGWGRFLDSQFGSYIDIAIYIAIAWLFVSKQIITSIPHEYLVIFTLLVPLVGSKAQSVKHQKKNYENRIKSKVAVALDLNQTINSSSNSYVESGDGQFVNKKSLGFLKKVESLVTSILGLWQGLSFPLLALSFFGGYLEWYVVAALFFACYSLAYSWLKASMTSRYLKKNPL